MHFEIGRGAVWLIRTVWSLLTLLVAVAMHLLFSVGTTFAFAVAVGVWSFGWWYAACWSRSLFGSVNKNVVYVRYGVLWRREALIPLSALRVVELWASPLHRVFRCRTAVLRFAGGAMRIPFLSQKDATRLCGFLESAEGEW